jgi:hypothetical protein
VNIRGYQVDGRDGALRAGESPVGKKKEEIGSMIIGAAIAGLLIVSLFLEMVSSSPKRSEDHSHELGHVK